MILKLSKNLVMISFRNLGFSCICVVNHKMMCSSKSITYINPVIDNRLDIAFPDLNNEIPSSVENATSLMQFNNVKQRRSNSHASLEDRVDVNAIFIHQPDDISSPPHLLNDCTKVQISGEGKSY